MVESSEQIAAKELEEKMTEMVVEEKPVESAKLSKAAKKRLKEKEKNPEVVSRLMQQIMQWKGTLPERPSGDVFSSEREKSLPARKR